MYRLHPFIVLNSSYLVQSFYLNDLLAVNIGKWAGISFTLISCRALCLDSMSPMPLSSPNVPLYVCLCPNSMSIWLYPMHVPAPPIIPYNLTMSPCPSYYWLCILLIPLRNVSVLPTYVPMPPYYIPMSPTYVPTPFPCVPYHLLSLFPMSAYAPSHISCIPFLCHHTSP